MPVSPQFSAILPMLPQGIAMSRAIAEGKMEPLDFQPGMMGPVTPVAHVEDHRLETSEARLPVRIYAPRRDAVLPLVIYYHGGGFISGDVNTHDELTRLLALAADAVVLSVSYRLAPAHPFPAALHDCLAALEWGVAHAAEIGADATRLAVAGDSAGGNLAAVVAQQLRGKSGPKLAAQLLIYPGTDFSGAPAGSMLETGEGYYMSQDDMAYYHECYIGAANPADPRISPLRAASLAGLPPAYVLTAQYDPLRDQGIAYAKRLQEEGVPTEAVHYSEAIHGFLSFPVPMGKEAIAACGAWLKARLG